MEIIRGNKNVGSSRVSEHPNSTFEGEVWSDPILTHADNIRVNNITFMPGARTHWHRHSEGQLLIILLGRGRVSTDTESFEVRAGDAVYSPPGERHWHGASDDQMMAHLAISIGETQWEDPVQEA